MIDQWYQQYSAELTGYIRSRGFTPEDAQDLCSQVFLEAVQRQPADIAPRAWLYLVAQHRIVDYRRREACSPTDAPLTEWHTADDDTEKQAVDDDEQAQLRALIGQLVPSHQHVLTLRFIQGLSLRETARALSTTVSAVKARQRRAQEALRRLAEPPKPEPLPAPAEPDPEPDGIMCLDNHAALLARCLRLEMENYELRSATL